MAIDAPRTVQVHRKEIYDQIREENLRSSKLSAEDVAGLVSPVRQKPIMKLVDDEEPASGSHGAFMAAAIEEAMTGLRDGGVPIGSVLVRNGKIIGRGHNKRVQTGDPMAHAEIDCLKNAGRQKSYADTVLYSTLMPCYLCSGAAVQFGVPKIVVGESVNFTGGDNGATHSKCGTTPQFLKSAGIELIDLRDQQCIDMMARFIREQPELWNEDIGR